MNICCCFSTTPLHLHLHLHRVFFCLLLHLKKSLIVQEIKIMLLLLLLLLLGACFLVKFTFGMDFWCREYQDCHHLFDMFHSCRLHFDSVDHSNVNLIELVVSDCLGLRVVLDVKFLRQPFQMNQK